MKVKTTTASRSRTRGSNKKNNSSLDGKKQRQVAHSLQESEAILANAEEVAKLGSWKWDLHAKKVTWSGGMFHLFGVDRKSFDGDLDQIIAARIHPEDVAAVNEANRRVLEERNPIPLSYRIVLPNGTERTVWAQGKLVCDENGQPQFLTGYVQDITERVRAENKIIQLKRMYATLSQVNQVIVRVKDRQGLFQAICEIAVKYGEFSPAWIGLMQEESGDVQHVASTGLEIDQRSQHPINIRESPFQNGLIAEAVNTSQVVISENIQTDKRAILQHGQVNGLPFHSLAAVPFRLRGRTVGVLVLTSPQKGLFKDPEEISLLEEMAVDISFALDTMENENERRQAEQGLQESEHRYRDLVETSSDAIFINCQDKIVFINRRGLEMLGATDYDQIIGRSPFEIFHPDFHPLIRERIRQVMIDQGSVSTIEETVITLDGRTIPVEVGATRIEVNGAPSIQVILRDITKRKKAEEGLRLSEENFAKAFKSSPAALMITRLQDGKYLELNDAYSAIVGYDRADLIGRRTTDFNIYVDKGDRKLIVERLLASGSVHDYESSIRHRSGESRNVIAAQELIAFNGETCIMTHLLDITERKRVERKLRQSEEKFRAVFEHSPDIIFTVDREMRIQFINRAPAGISLVDTLQSSCLDYVQPEYHSLVKEKINQVFQTGQPESFEVQALGDNDSLAWYSTRLARIRVEDGIDQVLIITTNITQQKQAQEKLRQSEERYRLISENTADVIWVLDPVAGKLKYISPSVEKLGGYTPAEVLKLPLSNLLTPESLQHVNGLLGGYLPKMIAKGSGMDSFTQEVDHPRKDGSIVHTEVTTTFLFNPQGEVEVIGVSRDITDRKQAEQDLRENEERLRLSLHAANQGLYDLNVQTGDAIVNREYAEMLGYEYETFVETNARWIERLHPDDQEIAAKAYQDYIGGLRPDYRIEFRQKTKDGSWKWILSMGRVIEYDAEGRPLRMLGTHTDITERKRAEEELRVSEERHRSLIENMNDIVMEVDENGNYSYLSPNYAKNSEYSSEEELGGTALKHIHPDDLPLVLEKLGQAFYSERQSATYRVQRKNGEWRWLETVAKPYRTSDNSLHLITVARDITERKQAEEALKQNEHVLRLFVEHSPASIAMFDRDMHYIVASRRYLADYRLDDQELTGRSHYEVFPEIPERWKEIHRRCLAGAVEKEEEDPFPREDGTLDWVRWEIRPWYEETGRVGGIILFSEVITERKQIQDDLRQLNLSLEQRVAERTMELSYASRAKDEFLANMSHELRTPLNAILGLSESLLEQRRGFLNERQIQSIELIASSGRHLLSLINDILDVSRIEAGKLQLHIDTISIKELCASCLNFIRELALKKRIAVEFICEETVYTMQADPQRIKQILINLLTNAVKFTPESGRVSLEVSTTVNRERILFSISDTGIGIAQKDLKKLFTPFIQLDSSLARQYAGTGLGLSLVQKLTEAQGGNVQVESEIGKGSRFTIILPLNKNFGEKTAETGSSELKKVNQAAEVASHEIKMVVLLAEDNQVNFQMMRTYLESYGYIVLGAQNGEEVLQRVEEVAPDIILMDIQMPGMDGLETTRCLRQDSRFAATPIIALTALVMPGDRERCLEAGANEYLSKPVSLAVLLKTIRRLVKPEVNKGRGQ